MSLREVGIYCLFGGVLVFGLHTIGYIIWAEYFRHKRSRRSG